MLRNPTHPSIAVRLFFALMLTMSLAACGRKGPLYIPPPAEGGDIQTIQDVRL